MSTKTLIGLGIGAFMLFVLVAAFFFYQHIENKKELELIQFQEKIRQEQLKKEQEQAKDMIAWQTAEGLNTIRAFEDYLSQQSNGLFRDQANAAILRLEEEERERLYYLEKEEKMYRLAARAGDLIIVKKYDNGTNKTTKVKDWSYKIEEATNKGFYNIDVDLSWNGDIITSNYYAASGIISVYEDGSQVNWKATYINERLANYIEGMNGLVLGTVVTVGAVEAFSN